MRKRFLKRLTSNDRMLKKRTRRIWECVRRSQDYLADFQKYGDRRLTGDIKVEMREKWNMWDKLKNPNEPLPECFILNEPLPEYFILDEFPIPQTPDVHLNYFKDRFGQKPVPNTAAPGDIVREKRGPEYIAAPGDIVNDKRDGVWKQMRIKNWSIWNPSKKVWEVLTAETCPRSISITIDIDQFYSKSELEELLLGFFELGYQKVIDLQKLFFSKKTRRPRLGDEKDFDKLMKVYDLRNEPNRISWSDIALKIFPEEAHRNMAYKRKPKKDLLPHQSAVDKVKDYYKQADMLINKGGWKYL